MTEPREALAALREAWHEEDQAEAQMSVAYYDGEKREAERRLTSARGAAREAEAAAGVHLGDEGLRTALLLAEWQQDFTDEGEPYGWLCASCGRHEDKVHDPDCLIRSALAAQENPGYVPMNDDRAARAAVRKFLDERATMRGIAQEDIASVHVGTDREAHLRRSDLVALLRSEGPGLDALIADAVEAHFSKGRHGMSLHACGNAVAMDVRAALAAQENPA